MGSIQNGEGEVDLSHHFNSTTRARQPSPLKELLKYMQYDGMISLGGGLPHPSLFPFQKATFETFPSDIEIDASQVMQKGPLDQITLSKAEEVGQLMSLTTAMQYGDGAGDKNYLKWATNFTKTVFEPKFDFDVIGTCGNTDAWCKVVRMLCEPGEHILCEEYTFPTAQALWIPLGCKAVPVAMDGDGMRADHLEKVLSEWDVTHPGIKRPHLVYIVPVGSNPTGSTIPAERRKALYDVCVKYDIIICEDDPYCFLQYPAYQINAEPKTIQKDSSSFVASLAPSFLKYDYQGRVIRLDTFSKTLGPGLRLGYIVCNKTFRLPLLSASQVETQSPSGWSQAIVLGVLTKWGHDGLIQWLSNLRDSYQTRRDWMCASFAKNFQIVSASEVSVPGAEGIVAFAKNDISRTKPLFSFVPPTGGMFIWARFYFSSSPKFKKLQEDPSCEDPETTFEDELWLGMAKALVLLIQGKQYIPWQGRDKLSTSSRGGEKGVGNFRLSFSSTSRDDMEQGIERMAKVLSSYFEVTN